MPRVASLYLPNLATDRVRRIERPGAGRQPSSGKDAAPLLLPINGSGSDDEWLPPARWPENAKERAKLLALREKKALEAEARPRSGERIGDCSSPRGGGWRPGARWAQREEVQAKIDALPLHQRPPVRELGRRSEAMPNPFRPMTSDEARPPAGRAPYDLGGAFWQQGRTLGGAVAREVGAGKGRDRSAGVPLPEDCDPLVTVRQEHQRMVVAAASPAASALGLFPGMPLAQARAMVPGLAIRPADPAGEAADLERLALHAARHWTPLVETIPGEGLWLDISGSAHLFGGEQRFARRLLGLCRRLGLAARVAVADSAAAAYAIARCASSPLMLCPPGRQGEAVAALPLAALRIDAALADQARRLGIDTVGALAAMPRAPLVRRFGKEVVARLDEVLGRRAQPIEHLVPAETPSATRRFAEPILTAEAILAALEGLIGELTAELGEKGLGARGLALTLTRVDGARQRIAVGLARPSRDAGHILRLLAMKIEKIEPGFGIEAMVLAAERTDALGPQPVQSALAEREDNAEVSVLVDRLATRLGWRRVYRASAVESDVPERSCRRIDPVGPPAEGWERWPRPARLLDPPEPVGDVVALLPDGYPRRFTWRGQSYTIVCGDGPERIHGEWWRRSAERDAVRDYFQVEDRSGARFWLFRRGDGGDGRTGDMSWYVHGLFG